MLDRISPGAAKRLKNTANALFSRAERAGLMDPLPPFITDYHRDYPELRILEQNYPLIRDECLGLLQFKNRLTDVQALGGKHTAGGIHTIQWKSLMLKSGAFIPRNCRLVPRTADLLRRIPGVYTAFFSILDPYQYIAPHWGYWKGFLRYHLGVIIPDDNTHGACWIRLNNRQGDNETRNKDAVVYGERYWWRNGRGVMFDDTFLHDAYNGSNRSRVILWLDVRRRMPLPLQALNTVFLELAHREPSIRKVRENARIVDGRAASTDIRDAPVRRDPMADTMSGQRGVR